MEIIILFSQYLLISFFIKNSAIEMIEQIGRNSKLYPKHYCMPSPWMRKCFKLKKMNFQIIYIIDYTYQLDF